MSKSAPARKVIPRTYAELRSGVKEALLNGQQRIEQARVLTYWETGRLIHEHLLLHQDQRHYGGKVVSRLAADLDISDRVLYQCVQFARTFPILNARSRFTWAHYRSLLQVGDEKQRKTIEVEAAKNGWNSRELEERIRPLNLLNAAVPETSGTLGTSERSGTPRTRPSGNMKLLTPKRGMVGVYKTGGNAEALSVDLGFTSYLDLAEEHVEGFKVGDFVQLDAKGRFLPAEGAKAADLYTYRAEVLKVVDGDTLWMKIYLRPRHWLKEKLRLRGLDCPEMDTAEGKTAKRFVETLVAQATSITITTTKPDKYDRYLSDIFLTTNAGEELFLNNALLENGYAIRKDDYSLSDWEETA